MSAPGAVDINGTPRQLVAFLAVAGFAAAANLGSRYVFSLFVSFAVAVALAFLVGMSTAFTLNRAFVFSGTRVSTIATEARRFVIVNLAGLLVTMIVSLSCLRLLLSTLGPTPGSEVLAHVVGVGSTAVTSYFAHRYWTFRVDP